MRIASLFMLALVSMTATLLSAAEPTPAPTSAAVKPPAAVATDKPAAKAADKSTEQAPDAVKKPAETAAAPSAKSSADKASPQRFVPSEQVRADFDVSFPVDI